MEVRQMTVKRAFLSTVSLMGILLVAGGVGAQSSDQAAVMLEAAIQAQRVDGDLDGAIEMYTRILDEFSADRSVAARALLHLGECYELLGQTGARATFERLLREYPDQSGPAREARARLAALDVAEAEDSGITIRRVLSAFAEDGPDLQGGLSPDGRFFAGTNWETGNLAVHELATGQSRDVTSDGGYSVCSQYAWEAAWSPDGQRLAYHWVNCDDDPPFASLRVIGLDGSARRVLVRSPEIGWPRPVAWTPDGRHIVSVLGKEDNTWQIAHVSVADGSIRVLKTLSWTAPGGMSLSPDGRFLVYDLPRDPAGDSSDIFILATDGSQETRLVGYPSHDHNPVWTPAGDTVVFVSDRAGSPGLWHVEVSDGRPLGEPQIIKPDFGGSGVLFAPDGKAYYVTTVGGRDVWTVDFDPERVALVGEPQRATTSFQGQNRAPDWSPDGRSIAYLSTRGTVRGSQGYSKKTIVIRDLDTGVERTLTPNLETRAQLRWSPDGRSLLAIGRDDKGREGIHSIDVADGTVAPIVLGDGMLQRAEWSPRGGSVSFLRRLKRGGPHEIVVRDLATGTERQVVAGEEAGPGLGHYAVSPDGATVAYAQMVPADGNHRETAFRELMVAPIHGGPARSLTGLFETRGAHWWDPRSILWMPDGRHLLLNRSAWGVGEDGGERSELWKVPLDGGAPEFVTVLNDGLVCNLRLAPDGRKLAFDSCEEGTGELWVMENLLEDVSARD
jgi:Tol biopolymer transport system component